MLSNRLKIYRARGSYVKYAVDHPNTLFDYLARNKILIVDVEEEKKTFFIASMNTIQLEKCESAVTNEQRLYQ